METGGEKSPPTLLTTMKKIMTPKQFDKLIKASPFASPSLHEKLLAELDYKKFDTGGRNHRVNVLVKTFFQGALFLGLMLAVYIIGALLL
jgi:hypothetical protein